MSDNVDAEALKAAPGREPPHPGMVWIPGGEFMMGSDNAYPEEAPAHRVRVGGFWMDIFTVTNAEFERFVAATGYVTLAEKPADASDYPGAKPEMRAPSSVIFRKPAGPVDMRNHYNWWVYVAGANWRHPRGPASTIKKLMDHPSSSRLRTRPLMRRGAESDCPPRRSGSSPRAVACPAPCIAGATS